MSKAYPSMTALLGLLAVAGYQNRDRIAKWLGSSSRDGHAQRTLGGPLSTAPAMPSGLDRVLGGVGGAGVGGLIASGLSELVEHFTKGGHGGTVSSWMNQGVNKDIPEADLERAIGPTALDHIAQQTGLSRSDVISRLSRDLPSAIERYAADSLRLG